MIRHIQERKGHKGLFIGGEWSSGYGKEFVSKDPWDGSVNWKGEAASPTDVVRAVKGAKDAFPEWAKWSFEKRAEKLKAFAELVKASEELEKAISKETGKPLWEAKQEVAAMVGKVDISIAAAKERYPELRKGDSITRHRPYGVMGILGPFNLPGHLPNGHMIPALLAGNTVVLKASEHAPLVSEVIFRLWEQVGLPAGVVNLLQGGGMVGRSLSEANVDGLLFTGSYATGVKLMKAYAETPEKMLAVEMGGNNPLILSSGGEEAVDLVIKSAFITAGQRCTCARRLIVVDSKENRKRVEELVNATEKIAIGHYTSTPEPFMGPVINEAAATKGILKQGEFEARGGEVLVRFEHLKEDTGRVKPGIVDVTGAKEIEDEEVFAPLLQLKWVENFEKAIQEAGKTKYGLAAGLISRDKNEYETFFTGVKAGIVNWNYPTTGASSAAPFGGVGRSGNHRPSAYYAADYSAYPVASMEKGHGS